MLDSHETVLTQIQGFVRDVRFASACGKITDLQIGILPNSCCEILDVQGQVHHHELRTGYKPNVLVRVKVLSSSTNSPRSSTSSLDDVISGLENLLGESQTELFTVNCVYHHSFFSSDCKVSTQATCSVRRVDTDARWAMTATPNNATDTLDARQRIHSQLIFAAATSFPPVQAIAAVNDYLATLKGDCACPAYLCAVRTELTRQASLDPQPNTRNTSPTPQYSLPAKRKFTELVSPRSLSGPAVLTSTSNRALLAVATPVTAPGEPIAPSPSSDPAREIWRTIRRAQHHPRQPRRQAPPASNGHAAAAITGMVRPTASNAADDRLARIREQAVRNKRSISADTILSLALGEAEGEGEERAEGKAVNWEDGGSGGF